MTEEFLAAPDQTLVEHTNGVLGGLRQVSAPFLLFPVSRDVDLRAFLEIVVACHDLGKCGSFFQRKVRGEALGSNAPLSYHVAPSAACFVNVMRAATEAGVFPLDKVMQLTGAGLAAIANHHSRNMFGLYEKIVPGTWIDARHEFEGVQRRATGFPVGRLDLSGGVGGVVLAGLSMPPVSPAKLRKYYGSVGRGGGSYALEMLASSLLFELDEWDARSRGGYEVGGFGARGEASPVIDQYIESVARPSPLNPLRSSLLSAARSVDGSGLFYLMPAPTGSGKTLASLALASRLQRRAPSNRIIYVLPYISICDQVEGVMHDVLPAGSVGVDHSLALGKYDASDSGKPSDALGAQLRSWDSTVTVTTLVSFANALLAPTKRNAKKFFRACGATVVVDEIQAMPAKYMRVFAAAARALADEFGTRFVIASATPPQADLPFHAVVGEGLRVSTDRYEVLLPDPSLTPISEDEYIAECIGLASAGGSLLVVSNTRSTAQKVYHAFADRFGGAAASLTTAMHPIHRRGVISEVRDALASGERVLLSATQTVEAGVDLSFPNVVREMAPLPSIVQVAGRCNRGGSGPVGGVSVYRVARRAPIYAPGDLLRTINLLSGRRRWPESSVSDLCREYSASPAGAGGDELVEEFAGRRYGAMCHKFRIIDERPWAAAVSFATDLERGDPVTARLKSVEIPQAVAREISVGEFVAGGVTYGVGDPRAYDPVIGVDLSR